MASSPFFHPTALALWLFLLALCAEGITSFVFLRGLKKHYPLHWSHAGKPSIWTDSDLISAWGTVRYLQRRAYLGHGNRDGIAFCTRHRPFVVFTYWAAVVSVAIFFLLLFTAGWPKEWQ